MDYTELLPPLPVGDRFIDQMKFRRLGRGSGHELYECWDDAIQTYALAAIAAAAPAIRRAERERAVAIVESHKVSVGNSSAGELAAEWTIDALREVRDAIRALPEEP